jgi:regulator of ribonuclease activity A
MDIATADLCDAHGENIRVAQPIFKSYGGRAAFAGPIRTLRLLEDNSLVRSALEQPGDGAVLVVDGGGSCNCALLGDLLGALAVRNNWAGIVINGCIRDSKQIATMDLGVLALATHPRKSRKQNRGEADVTINIAGIAVAPGNHLYADEDGLIVADTTLELD